MWYDRWIFLLRDEIYVEKKAIPVAFFYATITPPAQKAEFFPTLKCNEQNPKTPA